MLVRVPDYYEDFRCLAGACPHSCCEKWEVVIDEETACRYAAAEGSLGDRLRQALLRDEEGDLCFPLNGGRCPFLDEENLCEIHKELGEEATSLTCREHPRFTEDYGAFREITLSASCPAANALLLGSQDPLRFMEWQTEEPCTEEDGWLCGLLPLRDAMLVLLQDRTLPLNDRLGRFLCLAEEAQQLLDEDLPEQLMALSVPNVPCSAILPGAAAEVLRELEILESDWPELLERMGKRGAVPVSQPLLERTAVYFAFRYLLKAVNDGDLLGRAQLCVFVVLTAERLAGHCGLQEAVRRISCEIEHSEENVETLLEAFRQREELTVDAFLTE